MKNYLLIIILLGAGFNLTVAQIELKFHNTIEERAFTAFDKTELSLEEKIDFFLGVSPNSNELTVLYVQRQVRQILEQFSGVASSQNYKKIAKKLFQEVHTAFFRKYMSNPSFNLIFEEGIYNCATATALYGILLDELKIPYDIRATTNHVFIIIDPNNAPIKLESTDPVNGLSQINKTTYVKSLIAMKLISKEEANNYSHEELYNKYVDQSEVSINIKELVGVLYMNSAIIAYEEMDFEKGVSLVIKGNKLRPLLSNKNFELIGLINLSLKADFKKIETLYPFIELLEYDLFKVDLTNTIIQAFSQHAVGYLLETDKWETTDSLAYYELYHYLTTNIDKAKHSKIYNEIKFYHHFYYAGKSCQKDNKKATEKTVVHLDSAYLYNPYKEDVLSLMAASIINLTEIFWDNPDLLTKKVGDYETKYSYMKDYQRLYNYKLDVWASFIEVKLGENNEIEGFAAFDKFLALLKKEPASEDEQQSIGNAYGAISSFYVRKKQDKIAKQWLIDGLKLAPKSKLLERKMRVFEDYELRYRD